MTSISSNVILDIMVISLMRSILYHSFVGWIGPISVEWECYFDCVHFFILGFGKKLIYSRYCKWIVRIDWYLSILYCSSFRDDDSSIIAFDFILSGELCWWKISFIGIPYRLEHNVFDICTSKTENLNHIIVQKSKRKKTAKLIYLKLKRNKKMWCIIQILPK